MPITSTLSAGLKSVHQHAVAGLQIVVAAVHAKLAHELDALGVRLLQVAPNRFGRVLRFRILHQTELNRIVTVGGRRLALHHHARSRLQQRHGHHLPVGAEHLRHPDLFAENSWAHCLPQFRSFIAAP